MKMKKLLAVLSASAIAVSTMAISAFAASGGDTSVKSAAVSSVAVVKGNELGDYAKKTEYEANAAKLNCTVEGTGVTIKVTGKVSALTDLKDTDNAASKSSHIALRINLAEAATDTSGTSNVKWNGTALSTADLAADDTRLNITDAANQKKTILFWVDLSQTSPITRTVAIGDDKESTISVAVTETTDTPVDPPEGFTDLGNWANSVSLNGKEAKAGDKITIDFNTVSASAQIKINLNGTVLPGFAALDGVSAEYGALNIAADTTKFEYTLTAADIELIAGAADDEHRWINIGGQNAVIKATLTSGGNSGDSGDNGGNIINDPVTPNIRPSAPTTEAAATTTEAPAEVVTGANGESVEAPKDVIPTGAVLEAKEQPKEEAVKAVEAITTNDTNKKAVDTVKKAVEDGKAAVMDINLVKDGAKVQPNGSIKAIINIPEILKNAAKLFVYRVEANGTFTDVNASVVDGKLVFTTSHFSTYIITSEALSGDAVVTEAAATTTAAPAAATTAAGGNGSSTDDKNQATGVVIAVIPAMLAAAGVIAAKKRK